MKSYKNLIKYYNIFDNWNSFLEVFFEENTNLIPYSHREMNIFQIEIDNPTSIKSIVDRNNEYFDELKNRFSKKTLTNSNVYSLIEKEIAEIQSYFTGNAYHLRYAPEEGKEDSFIYEFDLLEKDLKEGKIKGGDFSLFLVSEISAYCKYWDWLHSKEVSKFYFYFSIMVKLMSFHEIEKVICSDITNHSIDENTPIKDSLIIEIIIAFSQTTREIITNLKQYKETLSGIEKEFFNTDVLDIANKFFLNNSTRIHSIDNAHSKKSKESKKEIYHSLKSVFSVEQFNYPKIQTSHIASIQSQTTYRWLKEAKKLDLLYQSTLSNNLIASNTSKENFKNIFSKKELTIITTIDWMGSSALLAYFISELITNNFINKRTDFWKIAEACFSKGRNLKQAKDQYINNKSGLPRGHKKVNAVLETFTSK
jgi:hypothetical protein